MAYDPEAWLLAAAIAYGIMALSGCIVIWSCLRDRKKRDIHGTKW